MALARCGVSNMCLTDPQSQACLSVCQLSAITGSHIFFILTARPVSAGVDMVAAAGRCSFHQLTIGTVIVGSETGRQTGRHRAVAVLSLAGFAARISCLSSRHAAVVVDDLL